MSLKVEQGEETKRKILLQARKLFGEKGYHNTSIEDIHKSIELTKGALYHHFSSKKQIFHEMCLSYNTDLISKLDDWSWKDFRKKWFIFLDLIEDESFVQIWIKDLESVLSSEEMAELDNESIGRSIQSLLNRSIQDGYLKKIPVFETSQLIIGMINQSLLSLSLLENKDLKKSKNNLAKVMDLFLDSLEA